MKSRHSRGSISRYTTHSVEKFGRSFCRNHRLSICSSKSMPYIRKISGNWTFLRGKGGGRVSWISSKLSKGGIDCFSFVDFLRLTTFLNDHSSLLLSDRDVTIPPSRWRKLITRYFSFFLELVDYSKDRVFLFYLIACFSLTKINCKISTWLYNYSSYSTFVYRRFKLYIPKWLMHRNARYNVELNRWIFI